LDKLNEEDETTIDEKVKKPAEKTNCQDKANYIGTLRLYKSLEDLTDEKEAELEVSLNESIDLFIF
jgi:hypothetical protein